MDDQEVKYFLRNLDVDLVRVLEDRVISAGTHSVLWDGTDEGGMPVSTGIYFSVLRTGRRTVSRKMTLLD